MNIRPDYEKVLRFEGSYEYDVVPVSAEILSDFITPIEAVRKLKNVSVHAYMLESARADEKWGRYTFLGFDPKLGISLRNGKLKLGSITIDTQEPEKYLRQILSRYRSPRLDYLPPFTGGLVGYFSFDYLGYSEPEIRTDVRDDNEFQDMDLMLFESVIVFDNVKQKIILISNMKLSEGRQGYNRAVLEIERMANLLKTGEAKKEVAGKITGEIRQLFTRDEFTSMVSKSKKDIMEGEVFQIVLSNRLDADFEGSLFDTYRVLRTLNPSPYMFYFSGTDVEIAGASPETLVKLEDGVVHTFPLAGTRPRGRNAEEDMKLEKELLSDEKELAEHNMLVDLGRNDLGRVCEFGTVSVDSLHVIERFSHVMHIGSTVSGSLRKDRDALDCISSVLPAGTLSGAPKIRACQLIGKYEGEKRGLYGGAVGYIGFSGDMDMCIAIRLCFSKNGRVFVQSGAGIVADSDPEKEYEECLNKARATVRALEKAGDEL